MLRAGFLQGKMDVLEGQGQRELGRIVAVLDPSELAGRPLRDERLPAKASTTLGVSRPSRRAKARELATPSAVNASRVLLTSFIREPAPTFPSQIVRWPIAAKTRSAAGRACSGPEAKMVSFPCSAGTLLPDTGASGRARPGVAARRSS